MRKATITALIVLLIAGLFVSCIEEKKYVTITFNANGGTGTMANQTVTEGEWAKLSANTFTKIWKVFSGWATSPTGSKVYSDRQEVALSSNITLYAVWADDVRIPVTNQTDKLVCGDGYETTADTTINGRVEVTGTGAVLLVLKEGSTLTINGGIHLAEGQELVVEGKGKLIADADNDNFQNSAGIGGDIDENGGNLTIRGGIIIAKGGSDAVGIGAGHGGTSHGTLVIGKDWSLAGDNTSGDTFLEGPETEDKAYEGQRYRYMKTVAPVIITFNKNSDDATGEMNPQKIPCGVAQNLNKNTFDHPTLTFIEWNTKADGSGEHYPDKAAIQKTEDITLYAIWLNEATVITPETTVLKAGKTYKTAPGSGTTTVVPRIAVEGTGVTTVIISAGTTLETCGITVEKGQTLAILTESKESTLIADATKLNNGSAGIGSATDGGNGTITINGDGVIRATGSTCSTGSGAGIGGGSHGNGGVISIGNGEIYATGGRGAAGIGGGYDNNGGVIEISGGKIYANGGKLGQYGGSGIGGGVNGGSGFVSIKGGRIYATGGSETASGIGKGSGTSPEVPIALNTAIHLLTSVDNVHWDAYDGTNRHQYMNAIPEPFSE